MKILVAVDGSKPSLKAVQSLIDNDWFRGRPEIELLAVHRPVPSVRGTAKNQLARYYAEEGEQMLAAARRKLDAAGLRYRAQVLVGPPADTIARHAKARRCDLILIGTRGMGEITSAIVGSTAVSVLHVSDIPVLLVK